MNREEMLKIITDVLKKEPSDKITTTHNYIDFEDMIIRKGAIRSYKGRFKILLFLLNKSNKITIINNN